MEKCLDQCLEWLEEAPRHDERRLASVILLKELAYLDPKAFCRRADIFLRGIIMAIRDLKVATFSKNLRFSQADVWQQHKVFESFLL